jgi:hypothetical protein
VPEIDKYAELSDEQLSDILAGHKEDPLAEKEEEEKPEPDSFDDSDDEEPEQEAEEEEAEEEADDSEEEAEEEEEEEEKEEELSPLEKRLALLERRLELESLQREKEVEARKRAELLASKQAGRAGYLQQQLKQKPKAADSEQKAEASDDPWSDDDSQSSEVERQEPTSVPSASPQMDDARQELVSMAINDEGTKFANEHAAQLEDMPEQFIQRLQELMVEEAAPYQDQLKDAPIKTVRKLARSCMTSAFAAARIEFADQLAEQASTRKAESVEKSRRRKKKSAISSSSRKTPKAAPKAKSYDDMDLDELEAEMRKEFGENYRLGAARRSG